MLKSLIVAAMLFVSSPSVSAEPYTVDSSWGCRTKEVIIDVYELALKSQTDAVFAIAQFVRAGLCSLFGPPFQFRIEAIIAGPGRDTDGDVTYAVRVTSGGYMLAFPGVTSTLPADGGVLTTISL